MIKSEILNRWLTLGGNLGILVGLILLVYEMRQNSDLMRAQISMERSNTNMQIMADLANGGEIVRIDARLREQVEGFPQSLGWSGDLTGEEKRRYEYWMYVRLVELNNDWFQCEAGLVPLDICQSDVRDNMRGSLHRFHELGISFNRSQSSFIKEMQEIARLEGLPSISDEGTWQ